jgi:hypothetical protein
MNVGEKCFIYMDMVLNDFYNNSALAVRNATTFWLPQYFEFLPIAIRQEGSTQMLPNLPGCFL